MEKTYRDAGVDIEKGDRLVNFIKGFDSTAISGGIGGFAGGFELDREKFSHPVIMTTTDGVGTKLMIAKKLKVYDTVGIDLVAMCVNDLIAGGAQPVSFLDYIACGRLDEAVIQDLLRGIIAGCETAGCMLTGGETAEMPDMYGIGDYDLAGFAVGIVDRDNMLPFTEDITEGTPLYGLRSSGIHSNGFSLARKTLPLDDKAILTELMVPTKIYVNEVTELLSSGAVLGAAHITGGGLLANVQRILPANLKPVLDFSWDVPWIFEAIQERGGISNSEMRKVFNLGIGMVLPVQLTGSPAFEKRASDAGIEVLKIGKVAKRDTNEE
jgi:phosphoribosylformylglycinamidine cyclo-ligase